MHITGSSVSSIWSQSSIQQAIWIELTDHLTWARNIYQDNKAFKLGAVQEYEACHGTSISTRRCQHVAPIPYPLSWRQLSLGWKFLSDSTNENTAGNYNQWTEICLRLIRLLCFSGLGLPAQISQEMRQTAVMSLSGIKAHIAHPWSHLHWYQICALLNSRNLICIKQEHMIVFLSF